YVQYSFTADLEDQLDEISGGRLDWKKVLDEFWIKLKENIETASELRITQVIEILNEALATLLFPPRADGKDPKKCPDCNEGDLSLKLGKFGAFIGCSNYPECRFTRRLKQSGEKEETEEEIQASSDFPKELGIDPTTKLAITIRKGPYGLYLQLGEPEGKSKPKRAPIPRGYKAETLNLTDATSLLSLPRDVGIHPDSGEPITAGIGRFGPYLKYENKFVSLPKDDDVLTVDVERAVVVIAEAKEKAKTKGKKGFKKKA
ncbi:MAG: DNA topoisomerase I, partial [Alphaproteobacteria bacterium]|nr:DNA topoisomerase I [Alphaproteobacteria bacterium]